MGAGTFLHGAALLQHMDMDMSSGSVTRSWIPMQGCVSTNPSLLAELAVS